MSDDAVDLEKLREWAYRLKNVDLCDGLQEQAGTDVLTVLARLDAVTAERDAARSRLATMREAIEETVAECGCENPSDCTLCARLWAAIGNTL